MKTKILGAFLSLFLAVSAHAQTITGPLLMQQGGGTPWMAGKLNCTGALTCAQSGFTTSVSAAASSVTINTTSPLGGGGTGSTFTLTCASCITGAPSATGDLLYSTSGTVAMTRLADVAVNQVLLSGGVAAAPAWGTVANAALTNSSVTVNTTAPLGGGGTLALGGVLTLTCPTCLTTASIGNFTFSGNALDLSGAAQMTIGNATATSVKMLNAVQVSTATPNLGAPGLFCTANGQCSFESGSQSIMLNGTTSGQNSAYLYFSLGGSWIMRMGAGSYNNSLAPTVDVAGALGDTLANHGWAYTYTQHLIGDATPGATTATTPPATAQFGVAPSVVTVTGSDLMMTLSFTTGAAPTAFVGGTKVAATTVSFKTAYGAAPRVLCATSNDNAAAAESGVVGVKFFADTFAVGSFVLEAIDSGAGSLAANTAYIFTCIVAQ